ncbi:sporulation inhibitor KapD [Bacillus badius]|uniref:KapD, inhibitor of KinA pathway to sporulation n=1 Tax=Bacillus badius TaxID=1455 RepID=A0ABR5AXP3_BACBA|nr:KapD, inhibitor of KinA pathway to sporulation [Bacillus badius]KIL79522.1 KapD, inhibitor of KinA pathway to sporulation [Bacillus badius]TDV99822.1 sporulation inhibitor KapD [Bacillus badius]GLY09644.1 sporulation inhibitor KapD [Bacillus badius]
MNKKFFFIDFEFSMPDARLTAQGFYPEIIEAGLVIADKDQIVRTFSSYVKPSAFPVLTERCKRFLKIEQQQVEEGISFDELTRILAEWNEDGEQSIITWGNMDMKVLRKNCEETGLPFPLKGQFIDLSMEYKTFFGDRNQTGLWKAVQEYGKEGTGRHHRALDDALTTCHIYNLVEKDKAYMKKSKPPTIGDLVDFSQLLNRMA